jgi:hypothetical protein
MLISLGEYVNKFIDSNHMVSFGVSCGYGRSIKPSLTPVGSVALNARQTVPEIIGINVPDKWRALGRYNSLAD